MNKINLAKKISKKYHRGQIRKKDNIPYYMHPYSVVKILKRYGYKDESVLSIAYLHDTVEDTDLTIEEIKSLFGDYIARGVYVLSRNKGNIQEGKKKISERDYRIRLLNSSIDFQRVKLADIIHNTSTLDALSNSGIEKKILSSKEFYIPLGKKISPKMVIELEKNIKNYLSLDKSNRKLIKDNSYFLNKSNKEYIEKIKRKYN